MLRSALVTLRRIDHTLGSLRVRPIIIAKTSTTRSSLLSQSRLMSSAPALAQQDSLSPAMRVEDSRKVEEYSTWEPSRLIARINELEQKLQNCTKEGTDRSSHQAEAQTQRIGAGAGAGDKQGSPSGKGPQSSTTNSSKKQVRAIDFTKYNTRFIALKLAYLGQNYNGLEHANGNMTPLPTIEEELWKALVRCRLIYPPAAESFNLHAPVNRSKPFIVDWEGCDYSKCGRTDRGVSAFGQVIGIRVRSSKPKPKPQPQPASNPADDETAKESPGSSGWAHQSNQPKNSAESAAPPTTGETEPETPAWDDIADELPYLQMLNNVLPEDIRVLAWCPHPPPGFDARFSCRERRYRYFFTQPAFSPTPGPMGFRQGAKAKDAKDLREGWLDIEAMRKGAKYLEGEHDFRNFCKVDPSKQIINHVRKIYYADIERLDPRTYPLAYLGKSEFLPTRTPDDGSSVGESKNEPTPPPSSSLAATSETYTFTVHGSAFLWHQVRQMVGILFLIGQGLESPELVRELLDVSKNPRRPGYDLATDAPLVLWDTIFPDLTREGASRDGDSSREDSLDWVYAGDARTLKTQSGVGDGKFSRNGTIEKLWCTWRRRKIDEVLAGTLLDIAINQGNDAAASFQRGGFKWPAPELLQRNPKVFLGGNELIKSGKYVPVMDKPTTDAPDVINARYRAKKQRKKAEAEAEVEEGG